jgi:hypothetical protein
MKAVITPVLLAVALAAPAAVAAEAMYRSTMPDGSVRYGEAPEPGAKSVRKVAPPPPATGVTVVTPEEKNRRIEVQQGGTSVIPMEKRPPTPPATLGQTHGPGTNLPERTERQY